jgi:hypothetical protein
MTEEINRKGRRLRFTIKKNINDEAIEILEDIGVDFNIEGNGSPLLMACLHNNTEIARYCIEHNANMRASDEDHSTPLHYACEKGNFELIKLLIEKGAEINSKNKYSATPLARTIWDHSDRLDIIEYLLINGADAFIYEDYTKDDPRVETHSAYEYAKNDIKSEEIVSLIEKYNTIP